MTATSSGELNVLTRPDLDLRQLTERVDAALERALLEQRIVGALVLVARDGQILYRRAVGLSDREASTPMREDTLFRLASLTKPVVSVAALGLASEGAFELDAPLTRWLPDFRPRAPDGSSSAISVRHLLTHTSGLGYGLFDAGATLTRAPESPTGSTNRRSPLRRTRAVSPPPRSFRGRVREGAYGNVFWVDPSERLSVVLLTNTAIEGMFGQLPADLRCAVYQR